MRAGDEQVFELGKDLAIAPVAQHDAVVAIVEDEALADGIDRLLQLPARDAGLAHGMGEALDALFDAPFDFAGRLEQLLRLAPEVVPAVGLADERVADDPELVVFVPQGL